MAAVFTRVGDFIITAIPLWKILRDRQALRRILENRREKKHFGAVEKKREEWKARSTIEEKTFSRLRVLARFFRRRFTGFHRRTPLKHLIALYLGPIAVLSMVLCATLLLTHKPVPTQPLPALSPQKNFEKLLGQTGRLIADNHPDAAEKNLPALTAFAPDHPAVLTHSGAIHLLRKNYPAARAAYERALTLNPRSYIARYNLAEIDFVTKDYPAAQRRFAEMLQNKPDDETLLFRLALCTLMQNDTDAADRYIRRLSPTGRSPARQYALAARLFYEKNDAEARKVLAQARTLFNENTAFYDATFRQMGLIK